MSLDVGQQTERAVEAAAAARGLSVDAYLTRLLLEDSLRQHAAWNAEHPGVEVWAGLEADAAAQAAADAA